MTDDQAADLMEQVKDIRTALAAVVSTLSLLSQALNLVIEQNKLTHAQGQANGERMLKVTDQTVLMAQALGEIARGVQAAQGVTLLPGQAQRFTAPAGSPIRPELVVTNDPKGAA